MKRRLIRLVMLSVLVPVAARTAVVVAERMESAQGPSTASRSLRRAAGLANRRRR